MTDSLPRMACFASKSADTALQTGHFLAQKDTNGQIDVVALGFSHMEWPRSIPVNCFKP